MKKILHIAYLVIIAVLLILLWQQQSASEPNISSAYQPSIAQQNSASMAQPSTAHDYTIAIDEANLEALIAELQAENHALRMQLEERESELAELRLAENEVSGAVANIQ